MIRVPHVVVAATVIPLAMTGANAAFAQANFSDVQTSYWAKPYIEALASENIIKGFPDGSFRPNDPVTRAQFAALIKNAFQNPAQRTSRSFSDVKSNYWATTAIDAAYTTGFLSGYPNGTFAPEQKIPKVQALVSLASGLKLSPVGSVDDTLKQFNDQAQIPGWARPNVAAATQRSIPVNYPNVANLSPSQSASRADIAAYLYQALVSQGKLSPIASNTPAAQYIVQGAVTTAANQYLAAGTKIPVELPSGNADSNLVMVVGETVETSFKVSQDIANTDNEVLIPAGSQLTGIFEPYEINGRTGSKFMAKSVTIGNNSFDLDASSEPINAKRKNRITVNDITGSISTIAATSALNSLFNQLGNSTGVDSRIIGGVKQSVGVGSILPTIIQTGQTLTQKATSQDDVILVSAQDLDITLDSDFRFAPAASPTTPSSSTSSGTTTPSPLLVAKGSKLSLAAQTSGAKYVALPGETFPLELKVSETLYNTQNQVLIPQGSMIKGQLQPSANGQGAVFKAEQLVINGKTRSLMGMTSIANAVKVQDLNLSDLRGNVITSPQAGEALRRLNSGGGGLTGGLLGGGQQNSAVIIFDPSESELEVDADLDLQADA